jgi:hypothetical protein
VRSFHHSINISSFLHCISTISSYTRVLVLLGSLEGRKMILTQISYLDCLVFLIFLAPQLLFHVGLWRTARWLIGAIPLLGAHKMSSHQTKFLLIILKAVELPFGFVKERYFTPFKARSPFVQRATLFQDLVIRCVRYAFACMPAYIGRVFFSKAVALPFLRFRMLRHGYLQSPVKWHEVNQVRTRLDI